MFYVQDLVPKLFAPCHYFGMIRGILSAQSPQQNAHMTRASYQAGDSDSTKCTKSDTNTK